MNILAKTVSITNYKNMVVQMPGFVMAKWRSAERLEVYYNYETDCITIKPAVQRREGLDESGNGMA